MNESYSIKSAGINQSQYVSRLYSMQPIGCGLPHVESLISYVSRLATAHCVPTGLLVTKEIAPLIKPNYSLVSKSHPGSLGVIFSDSTSALNGYGDWAFGAVNAVEKLTCRTDIFQLTLLNWRKTISNWKLLKQQRAWCPLCFKESLDDSKILYEPLNWSLEVLKICPTHKTPLANICPHCEKENKPLSWYSKSGFCSKCREWLGIDAYTRKLPNLKFEAVEDEEQLHCIKCVSDLFSMPPESFSDKVKVSIASHLDRFVEGKARGKVSYLAQALAIDISAVQKWRKGQSTPTLASMISICYKLQIDFPTLFEPACSEAIDKICELDKNHKEPSEKSISYRPNRRNVQKRRLVISVLETALLENPPPSINDIVATLKYRTSSALYYYAPETCKRLIQRHKVFLKEHLKEQQVKSIREILERALDEYPPRSLQNVASESGIYPQKLRAYEKSLCKQVSYNYSKFIKQRRVDQEEILFEEMKQIAQSLYSKGIRPTQKRVALHLSSPCLVLRHGIREKLEQFLQENEWF
ncbi:TniQ family protein [Nodosilinea sp. FACHB-13]|uniref:TniQ family protein n=1 Tax=Cyanophyceae TaxID=3028117 RepID=UPI00168A2617|nr:TniQ family protein [Nodosilinea sp. FACHB-13]MBD2106054.1 TniQ family protein [Nodosilinea sp. FACHB-13]